MTRRDPGLCKRQTQEEQWEFSGTVARSFGGVGASSCRVWKCERGGVPRWYI